MKRLLACLLLMLPAMAMAQAPMPVPSPSSSVAPVPAISKTQRDAIASRLADDSDMYDRFVYNDSQTVDKTVALSIPVMPDQDIQLWLTDHVAQILSVTPTLYPNHMAKIFDYFVPTGWQQYQQQWQSAQIQRLVAEQGYVISAMVVTSPRITAKGRQNTVNNPLYRWVADVPVLLTYAQPGKASQTFNITLRVGLCRVPMKADGTLVAIDQWGILAPPAASPPASSSTVPAL